MSTSIRMPIPMAACSKEWVCGRSLLGLRVRIPPGAWMSACFECCVLSRRDLCVGLITRPEESYRVWCVWVWLWSLDNEKVMAQYRLLRYGRGEIYRQICIAWFMSHLLENQSHDRIRAALCKNTTVFLSCTYSPSLFNLSTSRFKCPAKVVDYWV
jgi:hypothetical protein